jgi:hypothetical protein
MRMRPAQGAHGAARAVVPARFVPAMMPVVMPAGGVAAMALGMADATGDGAVCAARCERAGRCDAEDRRHQQGANE